MLLHTYGPESRNTHELLPVLRALIGVNKRAARSSLPHGHQHRVEHELMVNRSAGSPSHDPAREKILDDGQIEPALPCADVGDIGYPGRVWARSGGCTGPRRADDAKQLVMIERLHQVQIVTRRA